MQRFGRSDTHLRSEDARFLVGRGCFTADLSIPGQAWACVVRADRGHGEIERIETAVARALPGVLAVFTATDLAADGLGDLRCQIPLTQSDGTPARLPTRPVLARDRVRFAGEPVAFVVAETPAAAAAGAAVVKVVLRPLPVTVALRHALDPAAPQLWPKEAPGNLGFDWEIGDAAAVVAAFAAAEHVVTVELVNNRVVANALEGRAALGAYDPDTDSLTLTVTSQGVHYLRDLLARDIFHLPPDRIHVLTRDVGGGFGAKFYLYPEYILVLFAARRLGRPVKWVATRRESLLSDTHGRDHWTRAALALDAEGRFLSMRVDTLANLGAYASDYAPYILTTAGAPMLAGVYACPAIHVQVRAVYTNTAPVDAYRGAGRPEAMYCLERLIDVAARRLGLDRVALRRRNLIPAAAIPYRTPLGLTYDAGDFPACLDAALVKADAAGFAGRKTASKSAGRLRGLGIACYIEATAGGVGEQATVEIGPDGRATVLIGTQSSGQGHETVHRDQVAARLGLDPAAVLVVQGDSRRIPFGEGTVASRSMPIGATALDQALGQLIGKATALAAAALEVAAEAIRFADGTFRATGTNRTISLTELVARQVVDGNGAGLTATALWTPAKEALAFPYGTHICEVEIDPETGAVVVDRYCALDDFGTVLNETLVRGQVHGGVVQGLGQALMEHSVYDPATGRLISDSFAAYTLPRAGPAPTMAVHLMVTPSRHNPLGIKGAGEAGAIAAPPTVINAVVDALSVYGIDHIDMPATPEAIWAAIRKTRSDAL